MKNTIDSSIIKMKKTLTILTALLASPLSSLHAAGKEPERPNIVFIFTDDQPQNAMGCMGNTHLKTPNMDRLAADGILFENSFVTTAICCVSRASLLTGQHMARHGINGFVKPLTAEQWTQTYPMLLRQEGYRTAFMGKLAVGHPEKEPMELCLPADKFDLWYGFPQKFNFNQNGRYLTTVMEEKAAQFIRENPADRPFLLVLALKEPHGPWDLEDPELPPNLVTGPIPRPKTLSAAAFNKLPAAIRDSQNGGASGKIFLEDDAKYQEKMGKTYRDISRADIAVGRVLEALRDKGCDRNTVVLFSSDHGSLSGAHRLVGKWSMYEESIRVPMIIRDPRLPEDTRGRRTQMALNIDLAPTMLALAGVPIPAAMQGMDLGPILRNPGAKGRDEWYYEHDVTLAGLPRCEGIRTTEWKYTRYKGTDPVQEELFHLSVDPLEENNLVGNTGSASVLASLRTRCLALSSSLK